MTKSLYGIFGGTFDPVHNGHIETVAAVYKKCALEKIHFIPTAVPPLKDQPGASPEQRLEMVRLAVANRPGFDVDDRELKRQGTSYTYDTVESLKSENPSRRYCMILGIDAILGLEKWYRWRDLLESIHFIVMGRPGWQLPEDLPEWWSRNFVKSCETLYKFESGKICIIEVAPNPLSATEIRYGLGRNIDVSAMMPDAVWDYICANNLYNT